MTLHSKPTTIQRLCGLALAAFAAGAAAQSEPQPKLDTVTLAAGMYRIHAEVARTEEQRETGLMLRKQMGAYEGMLFVFDDTALHCFWMKNTLLPLSIDREQSTIEGDTVDFLESLSDYDYYDRLFLQAFALNRGSAMADPTQRLASGPSQT